MKLYTWDAATGEYRTEIEAMESPREPGVYLIPARSTEQAPPKTKAGQVAVRQDDAWVIRPDHRGETWYRGRAPVQVATIGNPADLGLQRVQEPEPLAEAQARAKRTIDAQAESVRLRYVTPGAAQAAVYVAKEQEALTISALTDPSSADPSAYPLIAASVGVEGATMADVAAAVVVRAHAWRTIAAGIERLRLTAKAAVDAATTIEAVDAAAVVAWPEG